MRLRVLVGRLRLDELAAAEIDVVMALARAIDAVGPVEAGVEPLRRVRRRLLRGEHEAELVEKGARVLLRGEVAALPAPIGPGSGEAVEHLARGDFRHGAPAVRARGARSAAERHSHDGTAFSSTRFRRAGTPALRKYFCAMMSVATWLHAAGTWIPSSRNTIEPSGLRISLVAARKGIAA